MELEKLSKKELISEIKTLRAEKNKTWDKVKFLIAKISHEFKTPLNSIIGFGELYKTESDNPKLTEYMSNILTCSEHLLNLVQNMIDITRSEYVPMELSYSIFNTRSVIEEVINTTHTSNIYPTLINIDICADYTRFRQLVYNLISNAQKFSDKTSPINIITYLENDFFCFEISDSGEGIKEECKEKIFDFFNQVSDDLFKRQMGAGIGLSLCRTIVNAHNGNITVESEYNKGSTFIFKIPVGLG